MKPFPWIKQNDAMQCGSACLAMICIFHVKKNLNEISKICRPSISGRWGTAIITIVFIALLAAVCLLPYPYSNGESILRHFIE